MNNYRTIIETLEDWANSHPLVQTFSWGNLSDAGREVNKIEYPLFHVIPQPSTLEKDYTDFVFTIIIGDMVNDDESSELDNLKISHLILQDFSSNFINETLDTTYQLLTPITFNPFLDRLDDKVCGVEANITFRVEGTFCL
jgi:hypothetical protein